MPRWIPIVAFFFLWPLSVGILGCGQSQPSDQLLRKARLKIAAGELDEAVKLAGEISESDPLWKEALAVVGDVRMQQKRFNDAFAIWDLVLKSGSVKNSQIHVFAGQCARELGQLSVAEKHFLNAIKNNPNLLAHQNLAFLYCVSGRPWDARPHFRSILESGSATLSELALLADLERPVEQEAFLKQCQQKSPSDGFVQQGLAALEFWQGSAVVARERLTECVEQSLDCSAGKAMLGELLLDENQAELNAWYGSLVDADLQDPGVWYVIGMLARKQNHPEMAADSLRKVLEFVPSHRRAAYQLSQVLHSIDDPYADEFTNYAEDLLRLSEAVDNVLRSNGQAADRIKTVVDLLVETGRMAEAIAWSKLADVNFPQVRWPKQFLAAFASTSTSQLPLVDLSKTPLPLRPAVVSIEHSSLFNGNSELPDHPQMTNTRSRIKFDSRIATVKFEYQNGHDPDTPGARMFEQTGGGVCVIDFDADGWPDLFFAQGGKWDDSAERFTRATGEHDVLYRNRMGEFRDVSETGLPEDIGFGQGAAGGDYDNDGFSDIYIGNVGSNQLLQNMGDGTFLDQSSQLGRDSPSEWTASTVVADLNADGSSELVDINYLTGERISYAICNGKGCSPSVFEPAPDHICMSESDGTFRTIAGAEDSKGLGAIVYRSTDDGSTRLFISNDQVANVQLEFDTELSSGQFGFDETALQSGVAFNEDGLSMGCMGIAADDIDGNGLLDLFVTNFKDEANTLYLQDAAGFFVDRTRTAGLASAGFPFVGWGTQFLDADLDGLSDVVVANGHVDDYRDEGQDYHMSPLFFRNTGRSAFEQITNSELGEYFQREYLGRGLATFDWNLDGAMDFVVSNIMQRASIATNVTEDVGNGLEIVLHSTKSARDAFGTEVTVQVGSGTMIKQLTAGDGYMASNQRVLQFGLGNNTRVDRVLISWPSGDTVELKNVSADAAVHVVQGRSRFYKMLR